MNKLTIKENVLLAKRTIIENIFHSVALEGLSLTLSQIEKILENLKLEDVKAEEIRQVLNLKDAWNYLFRNLDLEVHLRLLQEYHMYIGRMETLELNQVGTFRKSYIRITGTDWKPKIPHQDSLHLEMLNILKNDNNEEKAIELFLWTMRSQMFQDGNKRVAHLLANHVLISTGEGILTIKPDLLEEFRKELISYYESNNNRSIKKFIFDKCIYKDMDFKSRFELENKSIIITDVTDIKNYHILLQLNNSCYGVIKSDNYDETIKTLSHFELDENNIFKFSKKCYNELQKKDLDGLSNYLDEKISESKRINLDVMIK